MRTTINYLVKDRARTSVVKAIKEGKLVRPNRCSKCKVVRPVFAHHRDYDKPLGIEWLCASCHRKEPHQKTSYAGLNPKRRERKVSTSMTPSLYLEFSKFCEKKKWTESVAVEEAIIQLIRK